MLLPHCRHRVTMFFTNFSVFVSTVAFGVVIDTSMGENGSYRSSWFVPSSIEPSFVSQLSASVDMVVAVFLIFTGEINSVLSNAFTGGLCQNVTENVY